MQVILIRYHFNQDFGQGSSDVVKTRYLVRRISPHITGKRVKMFSARTYEGLEVAKIASQELSTHHEPTDALGHAPSLIPGFAALSGLISQYQYEYEVIIFVVHRIAVTCFPSWYGVNHFNLERIPMDKVPTKDQFPIIDTGTGSTTVI